MSKQNIDLVRSYFDALGRGDFAAAGSTFADDLVWHQPGTNSLSGTHRGKPAIFALLGAFAERSAGSFRIDRVDQLFANGDLVAATIVFSASAAGTAMSMSGVDLLRVENGKIAEAWLFSADQVAEDAFWG